MVIGLVLWVVSSIGLIIAAVVLAVRNELSDKISKCCVKGSIYMQVTKNIFYAGIIIFVFGILSFIIVLIAAVLWIATAAVVAPQEGDVAHIYSNTCTYVELKLFSR